MIYFPKSPFPESGVSNASPTRLWEGHLAKSRGRSGIDSIGKVPKSLNVLPNPEVTDCALLEGNLEVWTVCCSQRFFPLAQPLEKKTFRENE